MGLLPCTAHASAVFTSEITNGFSNNTDIDIVSIHYGSAYAGDESTNPPKTLHITLPELGKYTYGTTTFTNSSVDIKVISNRHNIASCAIISPQINLNSSSIYLSSGNSYPIASQDPLSLSDYTITGSDTYCGEKNELTPLFVFIIDTAFQIPKVDRPKQFSLIQLYLTQALIL